MAHEYVTLRVELEPGSDPISGVVRHPAGTAQAFCGWIELTALIEAAHATDEEDRSER